MLAYSAVAEPIYYPRYLTYTAPAMALLLGVCIVALVRTRERATAAVAVLAVAATPRTSWWSSAARTRRRVWISARSPISSPRTPPPGGTA